MVKVSEISRVLVTAIVAESCAASADQESVERRQGNVEKKRKGRSMGGWVVLVDIMEGQLTTKQRWV